MNSNSLPLTTLYCAVCEVGFEMSTYSVLESAGMVEFCLVKLNNVQLSGPVDVLISTSASPTTADKDPATGK